MTGTSLGGEPTIPGECPLRLTMALIREVAYADDGVDGAPACAESERDVRIDPLRAAVTLHGQIRANVCAFTHVDGAPLYDEEQRMSLVRLVAPCQRERLREALVTCATCTAITARHRHGVLPMVGAPTTDTLAPG